ncbi:hypothetical protein BS47DRAFT_1401597 [Hydnum rufescens UP504]|uniref:Uncharacterized protein n=1 Tax=Hydnum rufescens UP504 TaxID=1448309 RepID=A0A9P6AEJ9_9AGAM|nr:hypothetical protein BS47DRAFT_1401597 [Hydnum rufescens UP504]
MGGTKSTTAICSWFDHALGHFKYIKSLEDHTGGGNGDDIGDELGSIKKEGHPDLNKCTSLTIEHFKDMGWYDLFNNCCGSKADVTKTINLNSTQSKPIDKKQSQPDNSGDTDDESNADELPCGKHHCHAGRSTGQDVVDEKIELSRCQMHVTEGIGSAFTTIASTYANSIRADDTRHNNEFKLKQEEQELRQQEQALSMASSSNAEIAEMGLSILWKLASK